MLEIVGCGMAGLLAANMLYRHQPVVFERQNALPHNHSAVLRFRTGTVGDVLGIPFKRVTMIKASATWSNPVADALAYSFKVTGQYRSDRSITAGTVTDTRYVAPPGLIARMAKQIPAESIRLNHDYSFSHNLTREQAVISTIPMPALMRALDYPHQLEFRYQSGRNIHATIEDADAYVSLMVPDPDNPISRISITGDQAIIECVMVENHWAIDHVMDSAANLLGIPRNKFHDIAEHKQQYQKIVPIDDEARKSFMFWATDNHSIFSLGRFATWRPGLLLDDLVKDVQKISGWLTASRYDVALNR